MKRERESQDKWAVILCGGRGSRMGPLTEETPKPLVEVHGKPILWYTLLTLYKHGFRHFVLPLGYKGEQVLSYVKSVCAQLGCQVHARDTGEDTNIAERIAQVADLIPDGEDFFLLNSDTIFDFDIQAMYALHKRCNALVTLSSVEVVAAWGLILMDGDRLAGFDRQRRVRHLVSDDAPGMYGLVNSGLAFLNKDALAHVDVTAAGGFEAELYQTLIDLGRAAHYQIHGTWFAIDTPKDLNAINLDAEDKHRTAKRARAVRDELASIEVGRPM